MARTKQKVLDDKRAATGATSSAAPAGAEASDAAVVPEDVLNAEKEETAAGKEAEQGEESGEEEEEYVVEKIVSQRYVRGKLQYEVKWVDDPEHTWEPAAHLADTEALEVWNKIVADNGFDDGAGDDSSSSSESEDDKPARSTRKRNARDSDYEESGSNASDDEDDSDAEYVPEFTGAARIGGSSSSKRQKQVAPLNDRQASLIHEDVAALSKAGLRKAFEALVAARPEVYATARGLLKRQLDEEDDEDEDEEPAAKEPPAVSVEAELDDDADLFANVVP